MYKVGQKGYRMTAQRLPERVVTKGCGVVTKMLLNKFLQVSVRIRVPTR